MMKRSGGWGRVTKSEQDHASTAGSGDPAVDYTYETGADGSSASGDNVAEYFRLDKVTYPNGPSSTRRDVYYNYDTGADIGGALSRLRSIAGGSTSTPPMYAYYTNFLGAYTVTKVSYGVVTGSDLLQLDYGTNGSYTGWDKFGRVIDQRWHDGAGPTDKDRYRYGYDYASNRKWREVNMSGVDGKDEYYVYDNLNRLTVFDRGDLTGTHPSFTGIDNNDNVRVEAWSLDALGNWLEYKINADANEDGSGNDIFTDAGDLDQDRTHNEVNEIHDATTPANAITEGGSQTAWVSPVYDAAGNMTYGPQPGDGEMGLHLVYDAWNRLVEVWEDDGDPDGAPVAPDGTLVTSGGGDDEDTLLARYSYDGRNRRIRKDVDPNNTDISYDYYYNLSWQVLEVRKEDDVDPLEQYVWSGRYIDSPIVRFRDSNTDGTLDDTLYYTTDANMNVTALVDLTSGCDVVERYIYDAYGRVTVLNGAAGADGDAADDEWGVDGSGTDWDNEVLYAGYRYDAETGYYHVRNRYLDPELGRWTNRDPIGYGGGWNLYGYVDSMPTLVVDPFGLESVYVEWAFNVANEMGTQEGQQRMVRLWGRNLKKEQYTMGYTEVTYGSHGVMVNVHKCSNDCYEVTAVIIATADISMYGWEQWSWKIGVRQYLQGIHGGPLMQQDLNNLRMKNDGPAITYESILQHEMAHVRQIKEYLNSLNLSTEVSGVGECIYVTNQEAWVQAGLIEYEIWTDPKVKKMIEDAIKGANVFAGAPAQEEARGVQRKYLENQKDAGNAKE